MVAQVSVTFEVKINGPRDSHPLTLMMRNTIVHAIQEQVSLLTDQHKAKGDNLRYVTVQHDNLKGQKWTLFLAVLICLKTTKTCGKKVKFEDHETV